MSVIERLAHNLGRKDDIPNQELAKDLATNEDHASIEELVANLSHKNKNIQSDCIKVLYEIGYLKPELIAPYAERFLNLLQSSNNRLVWGAMIALSTIASIKADLLTTHLATIQKAITKGSVITVDYGIKTLGILASQNEQAKRALFPYLHRYLQTCRPKDLPRYAEHILPAIDSENKQAFVNTLEARLSLLKPSQAKRIKKVIEKAESIQA